jgi:HemY protein
VKTIIYFLGSLLLAIGAAFILHHWLVQFDDPGYVLIGIGHWSLETSMIVFAVALVFIFFICYFLFRSLGWVIRLPGRIKSKGRNIKLNRSQEALIAGMVDSAEGNWEKAEKTLIKHASTSGSPLLHYLTAARAAHSRGAITKRDEYLQQAAHQSPDSEVVVGLTRAELHLSEQQFDQALDTLTRLQSIDPGHASVLKLLHETYRRIGDWENVRKLIPSLHKNEVLMEAEVKLLEAETFSGLLKDVAHNGNTEEIQSLWKTIPGHVKGMRGIPAIYYAAMIEVKSGALIEQELFASLSKNWDETLLILLGSVQSTNYPELLEKAEKWLADHANSAVLYRVLGKLCIASNRPDKAEGYLNKSLELDATVGAYQLVGQLYFDRGDKGRASECFKQGLELASSEVVSNVEVMTAD